MSKECRYFVQHAWKRDLCANCFESRQEHQRTVACTKPLIVRDVDSIQSILRGQRATEAGGKKHRVAFPEALTEVIGYGGDDYSDGEIELDSTNVQIVEHKVYEFKSKDDEETDGGADSEEDRALNNLTRLNTNFNMVTANLTSEVAEAKPKTLGLMLGRIQKDADGNKTTLLISVTPFGADDVSMPTARRPVDRKRADDRVVALEKIVDMPLITSTNLMTVKKNYIPDSPTKLIRHVPDLGVISTKPTLISSVDTQSVSDNPETEDIKVKDVGKIQCKTAETQDKDDSGDNSDDSTKIEPEIINSNPNFNDLGERTVEGESESTEKSESELNFDDNSSREEAGAPDGKADEDDITLESGGIISAEPRRSFLHSDSLVKKPNVPPKPISVDANQTVDSVGSTVDCKISVKSASAESVEKAVLSESTGDEECSSDAHTNGNGKRRMAPRPPESTSENSTSLFARKPNLKGNLKSDSPVVREKEKRERTIASSSPKLKKSLGPTVSEDVICFSNTNEDTPEPKRISLSQQDIAATSLSTDKLDEKKKGKSRFSLKKLLRMGGSRKDMNLLSTTVSASTRVDEIPGCIQPKPRLEIIHPLELDGAAVEVLRHDKLTKSQEEHVISETRPESTRNVTARLGKPPPPPRSGQLTSSSGKSVGSSPQTESSPKSASVSTWHTIQHGTIAGDSIYANLAAENVAGEVRSTIVPSKPQRTASIRRENDTKSSQSCSRDIAVHHHHYYEKACIDVPPNSDSLDSTSSGSHDVYEFLSSSPECDSNLEIRSHSRETARVDAKGGTGGCGFIDHYQQCKYSKSIGRSNSLPYCGSETESEFNSSNNFYTGNEGAEEDHDWKTKNQNFVLNRVCQRRNRTIVHRSLEDNYGAVVIANHESLAQLLERLSQVDQSTVPLYLRPLSTSNPRLKDFNIEVETIRVIGKRTFCGASWNEHPVTVCLSTGSLVSSMSHKEFCLTPIFEFIDQTPDDALYSCLVPAFKNKDVTVSIMPPYQVYSMKSFHSNLQRQRTSSHENTVRECYLVLLQFVSALKNLQARGVEELPKSLNNFVLCKEERDPSYHLYHLQSLHVDHIADDEEQVSLCQSALVALKELSLTDKLPVVRELLVRERAVSLSQVKAILEYSLWGPSDVTLDVWKEKEMVLQRWLDLERANVLHALVKTRPPLTVANEYQLIFLVQTTAKHMCEASVLLAEQQSNFHTFK